MATYADYLIALNSNVATKKLKVERLDNDENVIEEITNRVIDGSVQKTDEMGCRRTATITFENSDLSFLPDPDGMIWMNKKFRISTGITCSDGTDYYISQGIFLISEPEVLSQMSNNIVSIQFIDKWSLLGGQLGGTLPNTYIIPVGTSIVDAVNGILTEVADVKVAMVYPTSEVTPYTITKLVADNENYGNILIELANFISWTTFYDENGVLRFEPQTDITITGSVWDFTTNEIALLESRHKYEFTKVANYISVIGDNINGLTYTAYAQDNDPNSKTGIPRIGKKVKIINDTLIYSTALAQTRADAELQAAISIVETVDATSMCVDHINGSDIITITDAGSDLNNTRFLVKSVTVPLINNNMSLSLWEGRIVGSP